MLEHVLTPRQIDVAHTDIPAAPQQVIRRGGFWGRPNAVDQAADDRLRVIESLAKASAYALNGMAALSVIGHRAVTSAVILNEQADARLPVASLAQHVGESLTSVSAQVMAEGYIAIEKNFIETATTHLRSSGR